MKTREYQEGVKKFVNHTLTPKEQLANMVIGMSGETGEVCDIVKKHLYQGHAMQYHKLYEEIGDVMWYVANLCNALDFDLEEIMQENVDKLNRRYPHGFSVDKSVNR